MSGSPLSAGVWRKSWDRDVCFAWIIHMCVSRRRWRGRRRRKKERMKVRQISSKNLQQKERERERERERRRGRGPKGNTCQEGSCHDDLSRISWGCSCPAPPPQIATPCPLTPFSKPRFCLSLSLSLSLSLFHWHPWLRTKSKNLEERGLLASSTLSGTNFYCSLG